MAKTKRKSRKRARAVPAAPIPHDVDMRELMKGQRRLVLLFNKRKSLVRSIARVDDAIRSQKLLNRSMLTDPPTRSSTDNSAVPVAP